MVMQWARGLLSGQGNPQPLYGLRPAMPAPFRGPRGTASHIDLYRVLRAYYQSNGLFDVLRDLLRRQGIAAEALKPLRNPTYRVVEFYPQHLWPGTLPEALPIETENQLIIDPIQQIWKWSNWTSTKQVAARHVALYGDLFLKVAQTADRTRVFYQTIEPEHVTDFDADERDFLTYVRFDVPMLRRNDDGTTTPYLHTETWSKTTGLFSMWEHDQQAQTSTGQLGTPTREESIESMGIDFIPVVHAKFADVGEDRGMGAIVPALDKIDEASRMATRLHQMLYRHNNVTHVLKANSVDASGRPLPPPRINETDGTTDDDGTIMLGDERFIKLPGMSELQQLVPNVNYEAALHVLQDHMIELEGDLPELVLYRLAEGRDISGRAVRLMMNPAISRLEEARGNAEAALIRADQMALTMMFNAGLVGDLGGTFDDGAFEHCFEERDVLPNDEQERTSMRQSDSLALKNLVDSGMPIEMAAVQIYGWSDEQAQQFTTDRLAAIGREQVLAQEDVLAPGQPQLPPGQQPAPVGVAAP